MTQTFALTGAAYGIHRTTALPHDEAVRSVSAALANEGFGILTTIDVQATLKQKLGADTSRYVILGACSPQLAQKALSAEADIGLLLPCNVVVAERPDGRSDVSALRPTLVFERLVATRGIEAVAKDAEARLRRALDHLPG